MADQFVEQYGHLIAVCQGILPVEGATQPLLAATFTYLVEEGTVPVMVPSLLRRLPGALHSEAQNAGLLCVAGQLISIFSPFVSVALDDCKSSDAMVAADAFMQTLAQARPCRALADSFAAVGQAAANSASGSSGVRPNHSAASRLASFFAILDDVRLEVAHLSLLLLRHTLLNEPASGALREDMAESHLARHACEALTQLLTHKPDAVAAAPSALVFLLPAAQNLALTFSNATIAWQSAVTKGAAAQAAWSNSARCAAMLAVAAEPAFSRLIMQALMRSASASRAPGGDSAGCTDAGLMALLQCLSFWLDVAESQGPATVSQRIGTLGLTPLQVATLAMASAGCPGHVTALLVRRLYLLLPEDQRLGAYPAVAQHSGRLLDRLLEWHRSAGESDLAVASNPWLSAIGTDPGLSSAAAVQLFASAFSDTPGLLQRSRCVLQLGLLGKVEALLRVSAPSAPAAGQQPATSEHPVEKTPHSGSDLGLVAHEACQCGEGFMAALLGDPQRGPAALATYQSLLATTRKLVHRLAQDALASGSSSAGGSYPVGDQLPYFLPCGALGRAMCPVPGQPELAAAGPTNASARLAVRCCALQLLPPLVVGLSAAWSQAAQAPAPPSAQEEATVIESLHLLSRLHPAGLWDVSLAAGLPGLLLELLRSQRALGVGTTPRFSLPVTRAAIRALELLARSEAWLREARQLGLVEELAAWAEGGASLEAFARGTAGGTQVVQQVLDMANGLSSKCQALPVAAVDFVAPTWDSCALDTVDKAGAAGLVPFLGCWHRRCTNLAGDSEASLKLLKCSNCGLARYCSMACQKEAWKTGHRTACHAWKAHKGEEGTAAAALEGTAAAALHAV